MCFGEWGEDARLLAGGQTLGPMLNLRLVTPGVLVDINGVSSLDFQRSTRDGLAVGALTRQAQLEDDPDLPSSQPLVAAAIPFIAHRAIRNRGRLLCCGNVRGRQDRAGGRRQRSDWWPSAAAVA